MPLKWPVEPLSNSTANFWSYTVLETGATGLYNKVKVGSLVQFACVPIILIMLPIICFSDW